MATMLFLAVCTIFTHYDIPYDNLILGIMAFAAIGWDLAIVLDAINRIFE